MSAEISGQSGSGGRPDRHGPAFRRKRLYHAIPPWVESGALFFVTMCSLPRGENQLCRPEKAQGLLDSVRFYHEHERWFARLFLLMPDHVHALLAIPAGEHMDEVVRNWKRYTARQFSIHWERSFFDHRLRNHEQWELKAEYIRENPVRKGLVADANQWSHLLEN